MTGHGQVGGGARIEAPPLQLTVGFEERGQRRGGVVGVPEQPVELDALGLEYTEFAVSSSNEIQSVVESAVGKVDALYAPTDNTIAAGAAQVGQICKENKLPFVTGEEGMCMAGGLFTLSINYKDLGYAAGEMAVKILKGEAKPEDMPIKHLSSKDLVVVKNDEMAEALGIDLSALDE